MSARIYTKKEIPGLVKKLTGKDVELKKCAIKFVQTDAPDGDETVGMFDSELKRDTYIFIKRWRGGDTAYLDYDEVFLFEAGTKCFEAIDTGKTNTYDQRIIKYPCLISNLKRLSNKTAPSFLDAFRSVPSPNLEELRAKSDKHVTALTAGEVMCALSGVAETGNPYFDEIIRRGNK